MSTARSLGPSDLVWDHFSRPRTEDPLARVDAAAANGYAGIGLYIGSWAELRKSPAEVDALLAALERTGQCVVNIEALKGWAGPGGEPDELCSVLEPLIWEMADTLGCRYLQAVGPYEGSLADATEAFKSLCDRAGEHGLLVGIEFLPFTNIGTVAETMDIVLAADRANGGVCVDSWHLTRSTNNMDDIAQIPSEKIMAVQVNDGPIRPVNPNYYEDCLTNRLTPGAGEFDLVGFVQALDAAGSQAPLGLEVCSGALWAEPVDVAAALAADGMRGVLALARPGAPTGSASN